MELAEWLAQPAEALALGRQWHLQQGGKQHNDGVIQYRRQMQDKKTFTSKCVLEQLLNSIHHSSYFVCKILSLHLPDQLFLVSQAKLDVP